MAPKSPRALPEVSFLRSILAYDPMTGDLVWRRRTGDDSWSRQFNDKFAGRVAGAVESQVYTRKKDGRQTVYRYRRVQIEGTRYEAHRLAIKMTTGEEPPCVDHIDGDGLNNRWDNIRPASLADNVHSGVPHSASGFKGVYPGKRGKWRATVGLNGTSVRVGGREFDTPQEAAVARHRAAMQMHGEFARTLPRGEEFG